MEGYNGQRKSWNGVVVKCSGKGSEKEGSFGIWRQWLINSAVEGGSSGRWQKAATGGSD